MLRILVDAIRTMGYTPGFETYCMELQRDGLSGTPNVEEARRDYQAMVRSKTHISAL